MKEIKNNKIMEKVKEFFEKALTWSKRVIVFLIMESKLWIYRWEYEKFHSKWVWADRTQRSVRYGIYSPVHIVLRTIEMEMWKYWKERKYIRMYPRDLDPCIHGIQVDTSKQEIEVTISLRYPGELIGKGGEIIDRISEKLSEEFGVRTRINLKEIIEDPNQNLY